MITPFNRAELLVTYDLNQLNRVRDALSAAGIRYQYKCKDLASPTVLDGLFGGSSRGRTGTFGMDQDARVEYTLYVRREELDLARALLATGGRL